MFLWCLIGCSGISNTAYVTPKGYQLCGGDTDCEEDEYCGFVGVNTRPVCLKNNESKNQ